MAALLNNLAAFLDQMKPRKPGSKTPTPPTPLGARPGVTPPFGRAPRGTLLTGPDVSAAPRKTLLGS